MSAPDLRRPVQFLAFGFGSGLAPVAPGTFGTLVAVPLWFLLARFTGLPVYLVVTLVVSLVGIYICGEASRQLGVHDHGGIVWDEIAGFLVTMIAVPPGWTTAVAGFLLFRLFDIAKPWPIGWLDKRVPGGTGIMVDDIVAGLYGLAVMQALLFVLAGHLPA